MPCRYGLGSPKYAGEYVVLSKNPVEYVGGLLLEIMPCGGTASPFPTDASDREHHRYREV